LETTEFLEHVLPRTGPYCIVAKGDYTEQFAADTIEAAAECALLEDARGKEVYFAVGALKKRLSPNPNKPGDFYVSRSGDNIRGLRAYTMDLDAGNGRAYATTEAALADLVRLVTHYSLPRPLVVQSGFGLHVYWVLSAEVPEAVWETNGKILFSMAATIGVKADSGRSVDSSSILRVVGTHNNKYPARPEVVVLKKSKEIDTEAFHALLGVQPGAMFSTPPVLNDGFANNMAKVYERDGDFKGALTNCQTYRFGATQQDKMREPMWKAMIDLTSHFTRGREAAHRISKEYPKYSEAETNAKFDRALAYGPPSCETFQKEFKDGGFPDTCVGCPSLGKITSPLQIARPLPAPSVPLVVEQVRIPDPPEPFFRTANGIVIRVGTREGGYEEIHLCDDMYPVHLRYDESTNLEQEVWWMVKRPFEGWCKITVPHIGKNNLHPMLAKLGISIDPSLTDQMAKFMSNYVRALRNEVQREKMYSKLGWREDGSFALGDTFYTKKGATEAHCMTDGLLSATRRGIHVAGDFDLYKQVMRMYARPGLQAWRIGLYTTAAAPLYGFTGQRAMVFNASGPGGIGKSTMMDVAAAFWGDPRALVSRGTQDSFTRAALEGAFDAYNNLPVFLDEVSTQDPKDLGDMILNFSGGTGKLRSQVSGGVRAGTVSWSTILYLNANTDEWSRMASINKDSSPHQARLLQLAYSPSLIITKAEGDWMRETVFENYGFAGQIYAEHIARNRDDMKALTKRCNQLADKAIDARSPERYWTAGVGSIHAAAETGAMLDLFPGFPVEEDMEWLYRQFASIRTQTRVLDSDEMISEFLNAQMHNTLTLSTKNAGNIDNVLGEPRNELVVVKEMDTGMAYISRNALQAYCVKNHINLDEHLKGLLLRGVVPRDNFRKVMGAGTRFATGQVRVVEVDMKLLQGKIHTAYTAPVANPATPPLSAAGWQTTI